MINTKLRPLADRRRTNGSRQMSPTVDPFAESSALGATLKQELIQRAGGGLTASQVAQALGTTRQAVEKRRSRSALIAVPSGSGDYLYPACQFTSDGVIPRLQTVLRAFHVESPWTRLSVLLSPAPALAGRNVLEALLAGDVSKASAVAASFGEQGG